MYLIFALWFSTVCASSLSIPEFQSSSEVVVLCTWARYILGSNSSRKKSNLFRETIFPSWWMGDKKICVHVDQSIASATVWSWQVRKRCIVKRQYKSAYHFKSLLLILISINLHGIDFEWGMILYLTWSGTRLQMRWYDKGSRQIGTWVVQWEFHLIPCVERVFTLATF